MSGSSDITLTVVTAGSERQVAVLEGVRRTETVAQLKDRIHRVHSKFYPSRISLRSSPKSKSLKDDEEVQNIELENNKIYFKDLGPQVSWTTVFLTEYTGPLVLYLMFYIRPSVIYGAEASTAPVHDNVKIAMLCHTCHYAKRLLETVFVHRFSKGTMPIFNIFKNSMYYWAFGAWMSYFVNHPLYTPVSDALFYPSLAAFAFCEVGNFSIHVALRNLRPPGTRVRAIPQPTSNPFTWLFGLVSCPNYTYEVGAWISFSLMTGTLTSYFFTIAGATQMTIWALGKHRNYRKEFRDYPRRKAIFPFLL